jgi:hypothetical protein
MIAIHMAWALLIKEFGSETALTDALGGAIVFAHAPADLLGADVVAKAFTPFNTILIDSAEFLDVGDKMTWYALHELGHIFDQNNSHGDPSMFKSNWFVEAFDGGCKLASDGCAGTHWNPSDRLTTAYGRTSSVEDFADSFASTVLYNNNMGSTTAFSFMEVSQARMNIINVLIAAYQ